MLKIWLGIVLGIVCIANAATSGITQYNKDNQKIFEILADALQSEDNVVHAIGNAILVNLDLYTLADRIDYDMTTKSVQASGDVRIYREGNLLLRTKKASFNLNDQYGLIEPLYLQDTQTGIWINSKNGMSKKNEYVFKQAVVSGCAIQNPIWRISASSGKYSDDTKVASLWNPRVYIGDVPIFYFPYFRFSTDMSRKSGLLMPSFATSSTEGFVYAQPYFWAIKSFLDTTITPQVRTERGAGGQIEIRAVDSHNDRTFLDFGYLYNGDNYMQQFNVRNRHVYGFRFYHLGRAPLQKYFKLKSELDNGIYLNFLYMNDLDYYRIKSIYRRVYDPTYTSKFNIYLQTQKHYFGLNMRYFLNLAQITNDNTLQSLPNLQYHKYLDSLFFKGLLYSVDYQFKNTMRRVGYGYIEIGIRVPVGIQLSLLKKFISIGVWSEFYGENLLITSASNSYVPTLQEGKNLGALTNGNIFSANYSVSLNSDIARAYNRFFHSIQFEALFNGPYLSYSNGLLDRNIGILSAQTKQNSLMSQNRYQIIDPNGNMVFYDDIWDPSGISAYSIVNQTLDLKLTQYFLTNTGKEILYWRLFQRLNFDELQSEANRTNGIIDPKNIAKRPLESKFGFSPIQGLNVSFSLFYSFYLQRMSEIASTISFTRNSFQSSLTYYYKDKQAYDALSNILVTQIGAHYMRASLAYDLKIFSFRASTGYDVEKNLLLDWNIGIYKSVRCFGIGLSFVNQRRPILTSDVENPYYVQQNYYVRLTFNFVPLTSFGLTTRFNR